MRENEQNMMINGANADMLYANVATYLFNLSKSMIQNHNKRQRSGKPITWSELDYANKELHHQLDVIISGDMNVTDSTAPKFESVNRHKKKLTESQLRGVIRESVKRIINERVFDIYKNDDIDNDFNGDIDKQKEYSWDSFSNDRYFEEFVDDDGDMITVTKPRDLDYEKDEMFKLRYGNDNHFRANSNFGSKRAMDDLSFLNGRKFWNPESFDDVYPSYDAFMERLNNLSNDKEKVQSNKATAKQERYKTKKALKAADKRPLHRKGSLNRAMDESIHREIRKVLH